MKIGLLEDDLEQAALVTAWLEEDGYQVVHSDRGDLFIDRCRRELFDLLILDWELPDQSGLDVLSRLRQVHKDKVPALFTTQRDAEDDIVAALSTGADDYVIKPLRRAELLARISAIARRTGMTTNDRFLTLGPIEIDLQQQVIKVNGVVTKATSKDFGVAVCLIKNQGKILSREQLFKDVWGMEAALNTRTVDMHVSRVRRGLGITPEIGYCIKNIYQHGYRLEKILTS